MLQFTISYSIDLQKEVLTDLEKTLREELQENFPLHAMFIFFLKSELETNNLSIKIEIASKKGISEDKGKIIVDIAEEVFREIREKYNLKKLPVAIWLVPQLSAKEVRWINPE